MTQILTITVIVLAIYIYRNLRVSNYFFLVSLNWQAIPKLFGIQEGWFGATELEDGFKEKGAAHFEYYIIPKAMQRPFQSSHIFDQQTRTFSESSSNGYHILKGKNKAGNNFSVNGGFSKMSQTKKFCFWIGYFEEIVPLQTKSKTISILFDEKYLNIRNAHAVAPDTIPFKAYLIETKDDPNVPFKKISEIKEIPIDESVFGLSINVQSIFRRGVPFWEELHKIFKNEKTSKN